MPHPGCENLTKKNRPGGRLIDEHILQKSDAGQALTRTVATHS